MSERERQPKFPGRQDYELAELLNRERAWRAPHGSAGKAIAKIAFALGPKNVFEASNVQQPRYMKNTDDSKQQDVWNASHHIPEDLRQAWGSAPGKNRNGDDKDPCFLYTNFRGQALDTVDNGLIQVLNDLYRVNKDELDSYRKKLTSSRTIKAISKLAGVFKRDQYGNRISHNDDAGNWMYKAVVEILRTMGIITGHVLEIPENMNHEKAADVIEAAIGSLLLKYGGKYEQDYPFRALWKLPSMSQATVSDRAQMRLLKLLAAADDLWQIDPASPDDLRQENFAPNAWAKRTLNHCIHPHVRSLEEFVQKRHETAGAKKRRGAESELRIQTYKARRIEHIMQKKDERRGNSLVTGRKVGFTARQLARGRVLSRLSCGCEQCDGQIRRKK